MPLDNTFRYRDLVSKVRHVRTPAGERFFRLPIGAPITGEAVSAARAKHGYMATSRMMRGEEGQGIGPGGEITSDSPVSDRIARGNNTFRTVFRNNS
jgi:hypothetical protein